MISVLLPTYNQASHLPAALESLAAQTFQDFELFAADDGSTDSTPDILAAAQVWTFRHPANQGTARAINSVFPFSRGEWITWVSSDNTYEPNWLEVMQAATGDDVGAVYSGFWYERPGSKPVEMFTPHEPDRLIGQEQCYYGPSFLIRREVWQHHRGRISHDYDNWLRVEEACWAARLRIVGVPVSLCHYRAHPDRATVRLREQYDAPHWRAEAQKRRAR